MMSCLLLLKIKKKKKKILHRRVFIEALITFQVRDSFSALGIKFTPVKIWGRYITWDMIKTLKITYSYKDGLQAHFRLWIERPTGLFIHSVLRSGKIW